MITYIKAIMELVPDAQLIYSENKIVRWDDVRQQPTEAEIQSKLAELQAAEPLRLLRVERDRLLSETDWWCVSDRTPTNEQLIYRQQLRDLPANSTPALDENGQLTGVDWPTPPEN